MDARRESELAVVGTARRWSGNPNVSQSLCELSGSSRIVFEAWTRPELFRRWWVPKSWGCPCFPATWMFVSGQVPFEFGTGAANPLAVLPSERTRKDMYAPCLWTHEGKLRGGFCYDGDLRGKVKNVVVMDEARPLEEALDGADRRTVGGRARC